MKTGLTNCGDRYLSCYACPEDEVFRLSEWIEDLKIIVHREMEWTNNSQLLNILTRLKDAIDEAVPVIKAMKSSIHQDAGDSITTSLVETKYRVVLYKEQYQLMKALLPTVKTPLVRKKSHTDYKKWKTVHKKKRRVKKSHKVWCVPSVRHLSCVAVHHSSTDSE